jgi:hypothetical protein
MLASGVMGCWLGVIGLDAVAIVLVTERSCVGRKQGVAHLNLISEFATQKLIDNTSIPLPHRGITD